MNLLSLYVICGFDLFCFNSSLQSCHSLSRTIKLFSAVIQTAALETSVVTGEVLLKGKDQYG